MLASVTFDTARIDAVAPATDTPLLCHWYASDAGVVCPLAVTLNTAPLPIGVNWLAGWTEITGTPATVNVAQLVTLVHKPVTSTQ